MNCNQAAQNKTAPSVAADSAEVVSKDCRTSESHEKPAKSSDFLANASDLIARGLAVIPVKAHSKQPLVGALSRSNKPEVIATWAEVWPDANVGVCSDENFTILETDDEAALRKAVHEVTGNELPVTLACGSGRPNRCAWLFKRTPACGDKCLEVPGIFEFRHVNQYVVGPGSVHPNGSVYRWLNDAAIVEMPDWLMDALRKLDGEAAGREGGAHVEVASVVPLMNAYRYSAEPEDLFGHKDVHISEGERHYALGSLAGLLHDGERCSDEIADILKRVRDEYCTAGKGDAEIDRLAEYAVKQEPCIFEPFNLPTFSIGTMAFGSAEDMGKWIAENPSRVSIKAIEPKAEKPTGWRSIFHTREETDNAPPVTFAIEGFLQDDGITFIGGPSGHGKTFIMLEMAKRLIEGGCLFGHEAFAVNRLSERVIYLVPESSLTPFAFRLKKFGLDKYVGDKFFYRTLSAEDMSIPLTDPRILEAAEGADVFLDTAVRFMSGEENSASDHRIFAETLFALLKAGARTVTGAHHSPKGFENREAITLDNALRGSGDIGAMLSTAWAVQRTDEERTRIFVKNVKPRDFQPCGPFEIEGRPHIDLEGGFRISSAPGTAKRPSAKSIKQQDSVGLVRKLKATGKTDEEAAVAVGINTRTLRRWREQGLLADAEVVA